MLTGKKSMTRYMVAAVMAVIAMFLIVGCSSIGDSLGLSGDDGKNGATGATGATGQNGADGTDGVDGVDGQDGQDGTDGTDGTDGINGQNATIVITGKTLDAAGSADNTCEVIATWTGPAAFGGTRGAKVYTATRNRATDGSFTIVVAPGVYTIDAVAKVNGARVEYASGRVAGVKAMTLGTPVALAPLYTPAVFSATKITPTAGTTTRVVANPTGTLQTMYNITNAAANGAEWQFKGLLDITANTTQIMSNMYGDAASSVDMKLGWLQADDTIGTQAAAFGVYNVGAAWSADPVLGVVIPGVLPAPVVGTDVKTTLSVTIQGRAVVPAVADVLVDQNSVKVLQAKGAPVVPPAAL